MHSGSATGGIDTRERHGRELVSYENQHENEETTVSQPPREPVPNQGQPIYQPGQLPTRGAEERGRGEGQVSTTSVCDHAFAALVVQEAPMQAVEITSDQ